MAPYVSEQFTDSERNLLRPYFTNLDGPVYAVVNLPELVKAALFARSASSPLGIRRLFLKEFVGELDVSADRHLDAGRGLDRGGELYDRLFFDYGDDSVAQVGGVHVVCEQVSTLFSKVIERSRVMSYVEPSSGVVAFDDRVGGRYRYYRDPHVLGSSSGTRYVAGLDRLFGAYCDLLPGMTEFFRSETAKKSGQSDFEYHQAVRDQAVATIRGVLPAASVTNVAVFGSPQAYEALLLRLRADPLPEASSCGDLLLEELRKVIPSFLRRVDAANRGAAWSEYLGSTHSAVNVVAGQVLPVVDLTQEPTDASSVSLTDFDPDAEIDLVAGMLFSVSELPENALRIQVRQMSVDDRLAVMRAYVGNRRNRRHRPGRALERVRYRFDVVSDYHTFRDLQRHRMLSMQWQRFTPQLGFDIPRPVEQAGLDEVYDDSMANSAELYESIADEFPDQASYVLSQGHRIRYNIDLNARSAMHLLELRSLPGGSLDARRIAQQMHRQIAEHAGHQAIAAMMRFVDHRSMDGADTFVASGRAVRTTDPVPT